VRSFLNAAPKIFAHAPVTWLSLEKLTASTAKQLARSPFLARIRRLDKLSLEEWGHDAFAPFADTLHLGNLRVVFLFRAEQSAESLRAFLANQSLTRLTQLWISDCESVGGDVVSAILASRSAPVISSRK
jgi:hypothetical protein